MQDIVQVDNKTIGWLVVQRGFEISSFSFVIEKGNVRGRAGFIVKNRYLNGIEFDLPLIIRNEKLSPGGGRTCDDILGALVKFFNIRDLTPRKPKFESQSWYWLVYSDDPSKLPKNPRDSVKFTIKVVLTGPHKYSATGNKNTMISDQISVMNSGTIGAPLTVKARAIKPSSYFMIVRNDEDYFMVSDDEVTKEVKDYMPPVYYNEFRDFKGWTKTITEDIPNSDSGGKADGNFVISNLGEGYRATNFPDTKGWVGASAKRGLPKAMTDFQITYKCIAEQKGRGAGRTVQHIHDGDGRLLASIGYENKYHDRKIGYTVVTLCNQKGDPKKIHNCQGKPIMYNPDGIVAYMWLRRVGNKFSIKAWKFDHIKDPDRREPIDMDEKEWVDGDKLYRRPVSIIAIYSTKYKGCKWMEMNGLGSSNTEILPKLKGAGGVIIQKGDLVRIDMQAKSVVINEEPILSEESFGGNYFNVNSGYNELIIQPENVFDATAK